MSVLSDTSPSWKKHITQNLSNKSIVNCGRKATSSLQILIHPVRNAFSIVLPPPNVTGSLHMGHAFQHTIMDVFTRYNRSKGNQTLWQPGTDHAGIATQMVVERQLRIENISRHDLGRDKFTEKVWDWKSQSGGTITSQMRRLGHLLTGTESASRWTNLSQRP